MPTRRLVRKAILAKPTGKRPDIILGLGGVTASPMLVGSILVWSQQNYLQLLLTVGILSSPADAALQPSLEENRACK